MLFYRAELNREIFLLENKEQEEAYLFGEIKKNLELPVKLDELLEIARLIIESSTKYSLKLQVEASYQVIRYLAIALQTEQDEKKLDYYGKELWQYFQIMPKLVARLARCLAFSEEEIGNYVVFLGKHYEAFELDTDYIYQMILHLAIDMGDKERAIAAFDNWQTQQENQKNLYNKEVPFASESTSKGSYYHFVNDSNEADALLHDMSALSSMAPRVCARLYSAFAKEDEKKLYLTKCLQEGHYQADDLPALLALADEVKDRNAFERLSEEARKLSIEGMDDLWQLEYHFALSPQGDKAKALAKAFDKRNGNAYYSDQLNKKI